MVQAQAAGECSYEPMKVYTRAGGLYTLHHQCTIVVRLHTSLHSSLIASTVTSSRHDHPPSSDRSKSTSHIGPPDLSVDAPTIPKYRSEPPTIRPFSPITPETPTRNPPSERQPLASSSSTSRRPSIAPPSPAPPHPRRGPRPRPCDLRCARRIWCKRGRL